jgi:integrase
MSDDSRVKLAKMANYLMLKANSVEFDSKSINEESSRLLLENLLSKRCFTNYKNILCKYILFCKEKGKPYKDRETVILYVGDNIDLHSWSVKYSRMIVTVLCKYILDDCERPKFYEIKRKKYNTISNRFDTQSYSSDQIIAMLNVLDQKESNDDLFILIALMAASGLRFAETKQLTVEKLINLFNGGTETIVSAKTRRLDDLRLLRKYCSDACTSSEEKVILNNNLTVGNACVQKMQTGITIRDKCNKHVTLNLNDKLFFKSFESYRSRFKGIKDKLMKKGSGVNKNSRNSLRGSSFHALRRNFANEINNRVQEQPHNIRLSVVAQGLRHTNTNSTAVYLQPSVDQVDDIFENVMSF